MSRLHPLRRSAPSIHQRLQISQLSTAPQPSSSSPLSLISSVSSFNSNPRQNPHNGYLKWISGIAVGSGLGLLYWSSPDSDFVKKPSLSFADWSTALEGQSPRSLLHKLSLPEIRAKLLFGGKDFFFFKLLRVFQFLFRAKFLFEFIFNFVIGLLQMPIGEGFSSTTRSA